MHLENHEAIVKFPKCKGTKNISLDISAFSFFNKVYSML